MKNFENDLKMIFSHEKKFRKTDLPVSVYVKCLSVCTSPEFKDSFQLVTFFELFLKKNNI